MADLIGTARIRVDMPTTAAVQSIRRMARQAEGPLRQLQRRIAQAGAELGRLSGAAVAVNIDDQTAAGSASVRAAVRELQRLGPIQISASLDTDATDIAATTSALRGLQDATRGTSRTLATLTTRATAAAAALGLLGTAARTLRGDMDDLDGAIRRTGDGMTALRARLGTVTLSSNDSSRALSALKSAALVLAPALIPIAAQAAPIAAGLTAAGVAVAVFGAAVGGQIAKLSEASDAEKKYKDAVEEHGAASAEAAKAQIAYQRTVQDMPQPTRTAAAALSTLKDQYRQWSDSLASSTMPAATRSFALFGALFPKLTPVVQGAGQQLNRFVTIAAGGVQSGAFDAFMRRFAEFATGAMSQANDALIRFTRTLNTGNVSGGASEFMEYVRANGPLVRETLSNLSQALSNILQAAANVGPGLLTVVNALAGLVAALPPGVITAMLQLALALKAVRLAAAGAAALSAGVTAFSAAIVGMQAAAAGATGTLPALAAAFGTLSRAAKLAVAGTGIGLLVIALSELSQGSKAAPPDVDKLTTSLKRLGAEGKVTGEAARAFGKDLSGLHDSVNGLTNPSNAEKVQQFVVSLGGLANWDSTPVKDAKENLNAIDEALAGLVKNGQADLAAAALKRLTAEYGKGGRDTKQFTKELDDYKAAIEDAKFEQQLAAEAMGLFGQQAQQTSAKLAEQKASADGLRQAIEALNNVNRQGLGGMIAFEAAVDAASKAAQENAGVLDMQGGQLTLNTDKQRAAAQALTDLAAKTDEAASAARESGQSWGAVNSIYERGRQQLVQNAVQMGLTRAEAEKLATTILKTPNKTALLKADITDWKTKITEADKQLKTAKGEKRAKLTADIADWKVKVAEAERRLLGAKSTKQAKLTADIEVWRAKVAQAEQQLKNARGTKKATLTANIDDWRRKISSAQTQINNLPRSKSTTLTVNHVTRFTTVGTKSAVAPAHRDYARGGRVRRYASGGPVQAFPAGGQVQGPGTPTSDSVFAMLGSGASARVSDTEYVVRGAAVRHYGVRLFDALNAMQLPVPKLAAGGMAGAGADAGAGLASGMTGSVGAVVAAARAMAAAVVAGIREELQIASPSKKTAALAKDVGAGFIKGLTGSQAKIKAVSADLAKDIWAAFTGRKDNQLVAMVNKQTAKLLSLAKQRDSIAKKIADANKFATDTASKARATGSLASIVQEDAYSPKFVKGEMQASLKQIKAFTANVQKLQKKGLNKNLLRQILEMGPEQGGAFAASLAGADSATIKQYNKLQSDIDKESSKLGKVGADLLYDSGKKAGDGFLTGLKAQQKQIEKLMLDIAKGMQAAIRKALGISSPARKLIPDGINTARGLALGVVRGLPHIDRAMEQVAGRVTRGARVPAVGTMRTGATPRPRDTSSNLTVIVQNNGVLGSQRQVEDWLARALDNLSRTNRLPRTLRGAA
ncbi:hypothetical protein [Streptomyces sp. NPDC093591]|uniref:hypothetical protein n=1 Tax=Streptomyces sp. NPDC093591 TaxID=3366044 RepID=UPI0037FE1D8E